MEEEKFLENYFERYRGTIFVREVWTQLIELKNLISFTQSTGAKTIIAGNGGSAAIASHCSMDLTKNAGMRCVNFNEATLITCLANDFGYERWLEKALEQYGADGDLVILISSSGRSTNMIKAADFANSNGFSLVTFTGFERDNPLHSRGKLNFWVNSFAYNIVEMTHQIWLLAVCDLIIGQAEYPAVSE